MKEQIKQDVIYFLGFMAETAIIYPFGKSYEEITESYVDDIVEHIVNNYENPLDCNSDELYESVEKICGYNLILDDKVECDRLYKEWQNSRKNIGVTKE